MRIVGGGWVDSRSGDGEGGELGTRTAVGDWELGTGGLEIGDWGLGTGPRSRVHGIASERAAMSLLPVIAYLPLRQSQ